MECVLKNKNKTCECMVISRRGLTVTPDTVYLACDLYNTETGRCIIFSKEFDEELKRQSISTEENIEESGYNEDYLLLDDDDY